MEIFASITLGWTAVPALVVDGSRIVEQIVAYVGGSGGVVPVTGRYIGATGLVDNIADAVDVRGPAGATGAGVAAGGTANQALTKIDGINFNTQWSTIDKTFVGLGNVDNTSDATKNSATATLTNKTIVATNNTISGLTNTNLSGSAAITYANLQQVTAFKIIGNPTNAAAVPSEIIFKQVAEQVFGGTVTWNGTPPSGTSSITYRWGQIGDMVTLTITAVYSVAGTTNTNVIFTLPSDCPTPAPPTGLTGASNKIYPGHGYLDSNITGIPGAGRCIMLANAANNGYEILVSATSLSARYAQGTVIYYV